MELPLSPTEQALAHGLNYTTQALAMLINCLKNNGSLQANQYENALRFTLSQEGAELNRLDYQFLKHLLISLESDTPPPSPTLRLIPGGKP